ncbi:MAG: molybdopterin synthase catalytic subunit, partial [Bacteroidia bacterium]
QNKAVENLFFEAYEPMAIKELQRIADAILAEFDVKRVAIHHRLGTALVGETAVIIGVSAPHRDAAFKACQFAIDTLKKSVPIWKKEYFADGGVWVSPNP